jgi:assimilatory nitrate reductase catalytic subunit
LFTEGFATDDGRARFIAVDHVDAVEPPDEAYPYVLTTGRHMQQYQSGNQTRRVRLLAAKYQDPRAELHPDLAARHGIAHGDVIELTTRRGHATFRAHVTHDIRPDTVFVPFHHGGAHNANALTDATLDPLSKMPSLKLCATALARVGGPDEFVSEPPLPAPLAETSHPAVPSYPALQ